MTTMANRGRINLVTSIELLASALRAHAQHDGVDVGAGLGPLDLAQAYRRARDPMWGRRKLSGPSDDRGVALARTLGLLAVHHQMAPVLEAVHESRTAAAEAKAALSRFLKANAALVKLKQTEYPLLGATKAASSTLQAITAAELRMAPSLTELNDAERNDELLLNATRELSEAFRPAEIARLVDDAGDGNPRQRLARVRRRIREELPKFAPGYSEGFVVPGGG
jgi:hypothetical protein